MRVNCNPSTRATVCASVVLPTPGRSSISRWPRASRHVSARRTAPGAPTTIDSIWPMRRGNRSVSATGGTTCEAVSAANAAEGGCVIGFYVRTMALTDSVLDGRRRRTAWITHEACGMHEMGEWHPERPARLHAIAEEFVNAGLANVLHRMPAPRASDEELI